MLSVLKTVGTAALPYLLETGEDLAESFITNTLSNATGDSEGYEETLGECAEKLVDTLGNNLDLSEPVVRGRGVANGSRTMSRFKRAYSNRPETRMIVEDEDYERNDYNTSRPARSVTNPKREKEEEIFYEDEFE